jgi:hypothetical protein
MLEVDDGDPVRGVLLLAVAWSLPFWLVIGAVVWWMVRGSR